MFLSPHTERGRQPLPRLRLVPSATQRGLVSQQHFMTLRRQGCVLYVHGAQLQQTFGVKSFLFSSGAVPACHQVGDIFSAGMWLRWRRSRGVATLQSHLELWPGLGMAIGPVNKAVSINPAQQVTAHLVRGTPKARPTGVPDHRDCGAVGLRRLSLGQPGPQLPQRHRWHPVALTGQRS